MGQGSVEPASGGSQYKVTQTIPLFFTRILLLKPKLQYGIVKRDLFLSIV